MSSSPEVVSCPGLGSRFRARLSVRGRAGNIGIGIFERGSHRLVSIPRCGVHHPSIREFLVRFIDACNRAMVVPYDEARHEGELRAIQVAVEPSSQGLQVVLLVSRNLRDDHPSSQIQDVCRELEGDELVFDLFFGALPRRDNSLFAERFDKVFGRDAFFDECGSARVFFPPGAFGQANPVLHQRVADKISGFLTEAERVVEYYSGVGTLGLGLAARGHELHFNEIGEGSIAGLERGWGELMGGNSLPLARGRAGEHAELYHADDTVVVDPPRKGLDRRLFDRLLQEPPHRLIYLSCGIDALLTESEKMAQTGRFSLEHLSGWTYFPFTDHVETLLVLSRDD